MGAPEGPVRFRAGGLWGHTGPVDDRKEETMPRMVAMRYGNLPERAELVERFTGTYEGRTVVVELWTTPAKWADAGKSYIRCDNGRARWARSYSGRREDRATTDYLEIVDGLRAEPGFVPDDTTLLIAGD